MHPVQNDNLAKCMEYNGFELPWTDKIGVKPDVSTFHVGTYVGHREGSLLFATRLSSRASLLLGHVKLPKADNPDYNLSLEQAEGRHAAVLECCTSF